MALKIIKGVGTIVWGAGSILGAPAGAVVESLQLTPKNGEPIEIEDNDGLAYNEVLLRDGFDAKVSCLYDEAKTWPIEGANADITIQYTVAVANSVPFGEGNGVSVNGNAVTYTCLVCSVSPTYAKKKEGMIDLNLRYRPNVDV